MNALYFDGTSAQFRDYPKPVPRSNEALIKVMYAGICRTDLEITRGYMRFTGVMGHEFVGVVEECHNKQWIGKRVTGEINVSCGECVFCKNGMTTHCTDRKVIGIDGRDGCFAEYIALPQVNLHLVPDAITAEEACFIEPLAACYQILEQTHIKPASNVVVLGAGKMGLLAAQVMKLLGMDVTVVAKHPEKLEVAKKLDLQTSTGDKVRTRSKVVIDCTGSPEGLALAQRLVIPRGKIIVKSTFNQKTEVDITPFVVNETEMIGSRCGPFRPAINALRNGYIKVRPMISHTFSLEEGLDALEASADSTRIKTLIKMG